MWNRVWDIVEVLEGIGRNLGTGHCWSILSHGRGEIGILENDRFVFCFCHDTYGEG